MELDRWYLVIGLLLILMVVVRPRIEQLSMTTTMLYLGIGWLFGWLGWISLDPLQDSVLLERLSEVAVIISLFGAGLKLRLPLKSPQWHLPLALASFSMALTVAFVSAVGTLWLGLPLGVAVLLGAILAPTDPVLASDVQVEHPHDTDRVRFALTGEAGMNDGTAFPFVMLGLGLLGLHDLGAGGWRWWTLDVAWAIGAGLGCGAVLGRAVGRLVVYLRQTYRETVRLDDFLALGLIAVAYGLAILVSAYGFLSVFAAGLALRRVERELTGDEAPPEVTAAATQELASDPQLAPAVMAEAVLHFNEQLERIAELTLVLIAGSLLIGVATSSSAVGVTALLFCVIRPLAVAPLSLGLGMNGTPTALVSWFGIRGIGSLFYLFYALSHGVSGRDAELLIQITLFAVAVSICVHGVSVTPLMRVYGRRQARRKRRA